MSRAQTFLLAAFGASAIASLAPAATMTVTFVGDRLSAAAPALGQNFGAVVDTDGGNAVVGSRQGGSGVGSGTVRVFNASTGAPRFTLVPSDGAAGDRFGDSVAVGGGVAVVGANGSLAGSGAGAAYVFSMGDGAQIQKLTATDGALGDSFGDSVAYASNLALVGAPLHDDSVNTLNASGSAYVFNATTGVQLRKLLPEDPAAFSQFGYAVAMNGTTALVSSRLDDGTPLGTGAAYLFDALTGARIGSKLVPNDPVTGDRFGESVALDGALALVGASRAGGGTGAAYLFDATTGAQTLRLTPSDGANGFNFGVSVALSDGFALVGASGATNGDGIVTGAVYVYNAFTGEELTKLVLVGGEAGENLGVAVAMENGRIVVGSSFDSEAGLRAGAAFLVDSGVIPEPTTLLLALAACGLAARRR